MKIKIGAATLLLGLVLAGCGGGASDAGEAKPEREISLKAACAGYQTAVNAAYDDLADGDLAAGDYRPLARRMDELAKANDAPELSAMADAANKVVRTAIDDESELVLAHQEMTDAMNALGSKCDSS